MIRLLKKIQVEIKSERVWNDNIELFMKTWTSNVHKSGIQRADSGMWKSFCFQPNMTNSVAVIFVLHEGYHHCVGSENLTKCVKRHLVRSFKYNQISTYISKTYTINLKIRFFSNEVCDVFISYCYRQMDCVEISKKLKKQFFYSLLNKYCEMLYKQSTSSRSLLCLRSIQFANNCHKFAISLHEKQCKH